METMICKECGEEKLTNKFYGTSQTCNQCCYSRTDAYERYGLNLAPELQTTRLRNFISETKIFLSLLGYDIDNNIHEQFKKRIYEKYGEKFE